MSTEIISASESVYGRWSAGERRTWAAAEIFIAHRRPRAIRRSRTSLPAIADRFFMSAPPAEVMVGDVYKIAMVATLLPLALRLAKSSAPRIYLEAFCCSASVAFWHAPGRSQLAAAADAGLGAGGIRVLDHTALVRFVIRPPAGRGLENNGSWFRAGGGGPPSRWGPRSRRHPRDRAVAMAVESTFPLALWRVWSVEDIAAYQESSAWLSIFRASLMAAGCLGLFILGIGIAAHQAGPGPVSIEIPPPCCGLGADR